MPMNVRCRAAHRPTRSGQGFAPGRDRLVGQPPLDVLGQRPGRGVAVLGPERHGLEADASSAGSIVRIDLARAVESRPAVRPAQHARLIVAS